MGQQRIHQRARRGAGCGVHDHASGFVHHDQIAVLMYDVKGDVFGQDVAVLRLLHLDRDLRARRDARFGIGLHDTIHKNAALVDQTRKSCP